MKTEKTENKLLAFYLGALSDETRLEIERELLSDPEYLLDYLEFKRKFEAALEVSLEPSPQLWWRLQRQRPSRRVVFSFSFGVALVTLVLLSVLWLKPSRTGTETQILFDSSAEHFRSSSVM